MKKLRVTGTIKAWVSSVIELTDEEFETASEDGLEDSTLIQRKFSETCCVSGYCGNGGSDKLIGVAGEDNSIYYDGYAESFDDIDVEEITE